MFVTVTVSRVSRSFLRRVDIFWQLHPFRSSVFTCKVCRESLFKKGTPVAATNRHRGWHGAVNAPMHSCQLATVVLRTRPSASGPGSCISRPRLSRKKYKNSIACCHVFGITDVCHDEIRAATSHQLCGLKLPCDPVGVFRSRCDRFYIIFLDARRRTFI